MPLKTKKPAKKAVSKLAAAAKLASPKNGKIADSKKTKMERAAKPAPAPSAPPAVKAQLQAFERAIQLLHKRNYRDAREWFEKARQGPSLEIAANAMTHVRMCDRRLASPGPQPKSAEEHYNYAVALTNLRDLTQARSHLQLALELEPRADHIHYAMAVCLALSGDSAGAYDSLKRAIELQPRNRMAARQDSDLEGISSQPRFSSLLYPETE